MFWSALQIGICSKWKRLLPGEQIQDLFQIGFDLQKNRLEVTKVYLRSVENPTRLPIPLLNFILLTVLLKTCTLLKEDFWEAYLEFWPSTLENQLLGIYSLQSPRSGFLCAHTSHTSTRLASSECRLHRKIKHEGFGHFWQMGRTLLVNQGWIIDHPALHIRL